MKIEKQDNVTVVEPVTGMIIEVEDDDTDVVWIFKTIDGVKVEGGAFSFQDFLAHVNEFYNQNF